MGKELFSEPCQSWSGVTLFGTHIQNSRNQFMMGGNSVHSVKTHTESSTRKGG
jgi:hypothetical protein